MDNASWAMDLLRTAVSNTDSANPNSAEKPFVSQFRIDGRPILPPLMTPQKRLEMQQLRNHAIELETKYNMAKKLNSNCSIEHTTVASSESSIINATCHSNSSSSNSSISENSMNTAPTTAQLQQTATYIYDNTRPELNSLRSRPQTLDIEPKPVAIPRICVDPPTPQVEQQAPNSPATPSPCHSSTSTNIKSSGGRSLSSQHRRVNNITSRIMQFENTELGKQLELQLQPVELFWQNKKNAVDKRMLRSSTSPLLCAEQTDEPQLQRSRSFILEKPSAALVAHVQQLSEKPPIPPPPPQSSAATARCRFSLPASATGCHSSHSLAHLRRDTVESRAKQVQRSCSTSTIELVKSPPARRRGPTTTRLQQQQKQLEQMLQCALHETNDALQEHEQEERKQLTLAKNLMFNDIKTVHRDRFQQLMQYQQMEQLRMQAEFDRQQKFLVEQICAEINVSAYAHNTASPSGVSEYTSTDDLPTASGYSPARKVNLTDSTLQCLTVGNTAEQLTSTARKRLFDKDSEGENLLPLQSTPKTTTPYKTNKHNSKIKRPVHQQQQPQRVQSKPPVSKKPTSPVLQTSVPPTRKANKAINTMAKSNGRSPQQQQRQQSVYVSKTRTPLSPNRLNQATPEQRAAAVTLINAGTRGFLVRRLFRTEQVQRIVRTIRDTLIFVLNLHMESIGNDKAEPVANTRLKARLLQQLSSASHMLHLIFFQTSVRERMDIIARDRKRIQAKLLSTHIKHSK